MNQVNRKSMKKQVSNELMKTHEYFIKNHFMKFKFLLQNKFVIFRNFRPILYSSHEISIFITKLIRNFP